MLTYGDSTEQNCGRLKWIHTKCELWARRHGASFEPSKYELIHFTRTPKKFNMDAGLRLGRITVKPKSNIKILGLQVDNKLKW